ncbi:MAG: two-component sensor histidine kinase [Flavobacteriaceae bacterium]|nr:two-component sensor histidine kinase [Flavobacteriaceae bacterium]|tara:strand:+ start:5582 stop:7570 length:1989 start_codon:yes stop_codon:yes gene_type:complete
MDFPQKLCTNLLRQFVILLFLVGSSQLAFSQKTIKNIDSTLQVLNRMPSDTNKVVLLQKIAAHYNVTAVDSAKAFVLQGLELSKELKYKKGEWMNLSTLGNYYERKTLYDSAVVVYNTALKIVENEDSEKGRAIVYNNLAMVDIRKGDYQQALDRLFIALRAEETSNNREGIADGYNNIGVVYYYMQDYDKATTYLLKALEEQKKLGNITGLQQGYNNVGAIFDYQKKYDEAIATYKKALAISQELGDRKLEASNLANIALAYTKLEDFKRADDFFEQSIAVREEINDKNGLAHSFSSFGENLRLQKRYQLAETYLKRGLTYALDNNIKRSARETYSSLAELAKDRKNTIAEVEYLRKYIAINDSILDETKTKAIEELETKYETEKKENEILAQRAQLAEKDLQVRRKNTLIYGGFSLAVALGLVGYLLYNQQKLKNRQLKKESELQTALARIETQNKLQEQRLRISRDLHDNIGSQLTFVTSSIDNLKYALEGTNDTITGKLGNISEFTTQTIYELRDTIWAMNKSNITAEDLQVRIANFIEKASKVDNSVEFSFTTDEDIKNQVFTSVQGMNVYRIIQEAVNNALKYAKATKISVDMKTLANDHTIVINIVDNGIGFNKETIEAGNGLSNIRKRTRDIGGKADIISEEGKGTTVTISFKN